MWQHNVRCEIICQGQHTCSSLLWVDSSGCFVIPFSQLSENLSRPLSPNLSPGGAPRLMLSLKMDTKSSKVGAGWRDEWGLVGVRILLSGQKSHEGSATRGLIDGGASASARRPNECQGGIDRWRGCSQHATWWKKKGLFICWWGEHK